MKKILTRVVVIVVVVVAVGGVSMYALQPDEYGLNYEYGEIERGNIESVVMATGTLEALHTVIVGSMLSGQIKELYVDFNDVVEKDQIIAQLDPRQYEAQKLSTEADVAVAKANIRSREAELHRANANLRQVLRQLQRRESLREKGHISDAEIEQDTQALENAQTSVKTASAAVETAKANLIQREASLSQVMLSLERMAIRSPVSGTVINRAVEEGQTVAASLQTPELFSIGEDLHRMKVEASIDEADIGKLSEGMECRFSVDAYPSRQFNGRIDQIRKAPSSESNVVTYKVIITANNDDLALFPGMTASVEIILGRRENVLKIPNSALRYSPRGVVRTAATSVGGVSGPSVGGARGGRGGPNIFARIRNEIELDEEQTEKLQSIEETANRERQAFMQTMQGRQQGWSDADRMRSRMAAINQKAMEQVRINATGKISWRSSNR